MGVIKKRTLPLCRRESGVVGEKEHVLPVIRYFYSFPAAKVKSSHVFEIVTYVSGDAVQKN